MTTFYKLMKKFTNEFHFYIKFTDNYSKNSVQSLAAFYKNFRSTLIFKIDKNCLTISYFLNLTWQRWASKNRFCFITLNVFIWLVLIMKVNSNIVRGFRIFNIDFMEEYKFNICFKAISFNSKIGKSVRPDSYFYTTI